jgi:3-phosphoshikimate 1-carboxyvinyltransferase
MRNLIVHPSGALRGSATAPGDKSISHRALLLGALAEGDTTVRGWVHADVCLATLRCVRGLGVAVDQHSETELTVHGVGLNGLVEPVDVLDCAGSGTTMRLLAGILAGQPFTSVLTGSEALRRRPMGRIADPLRLMGATVLGRQDGRLPPLTIRGGSLRGIDYAMPVASAQVKSAILLAGLFADGETIVREPGPARDHTERMLRGYGVEVTVERSAPSGRASSGAAGKGSLVHMRGRQPLRSSGRGGELGPFTVPGDFSSAAFPLTAGAIVPGSDILLRGVGVNPTRTGLYDLLEQMGATVAIVHGEPQRQVAPAWPMGDAGEPLADVVVRGSELRSVDVGGHLVVRAIDEFPIFAVAATQAVGVTTVREAAELRVKESDRIAAVTEELRKLGADVEERPDGMVIRGPTRLSGAVVESHGDHRLAMALAVAGLVAAGETIVRNAQAINDSFPGFVETMQALGAEVEWREA